MYIHNRSTWAKRVGVPRDNDSIHVHVDMYIFILCIKFIRIYMYTSYLCIHVYICIYIPEAHGPKEWASLHEMSMAAETALHLLSLWGKSGNSNKSEL